jgi:hypothetical protein
MSSRRPLLLLVAVAVLALPAAAVLLRVTQYFFADFDHKAGPGQPPPLAADKGTIVGAAPVFTVLPQAGGGGSLLITGGGPGSPSATMDAVFDKVFAGQEIQIGWNMTTSAPCPSVTLRAMEDNDGEIIDAGWGGSGGGGLVDVGDVPVGPVEDNQTYSCTLTLRDNLMGLDVWIFTITKAGGVPLTKTGILPLDGPLVLSKLQLVVAAGSTGTMLIDDLSASSSSAAASK